MYNDGFSSLDGFCLELLVQFLTFKSEMFEESAINKMELEQPSSNITKQPSHTVTQGMYLCVWVCNGK